MKIIIVIAILALLSPASAYAQQVAQPDQNGETEATDNAPVDEENAPADDSGVDTPAEVDEEPEDVIPPDEAMDANVDDEEPVEQGEPLIEDIFDDDTEDEDTAGPKKITIDAVVYVDYQFFDSSDAFKIKYHINMGGTANVTTAVLSGDAEIATEVTGFLARWPQGQCILDVNVAKVPYEINYMQSNEDEADININFKKGITERWESVCTFIGGVTRPFKSEGPPEKWIEEAFEKASPPISSIVAPLAAGETTSVKFDIAEYTVVEENLGNAKVKGTGIVTIQPLTPGPKKQLTPSGPNRGR